MRERLLQLPVTPEMPIMCHDVCDIIERHKGHMRRWLKIAPVVEKEALAIALQYLHLDWTAAQIAAVLDMNSRSLYRYKRFKYARTNLLKEARKNARILRGHARHDKDGKKLPPEAIAPEFSDDD